MALKKSARMALAAVAVPVLAGALALLPAVQDEACWQLACLRNTTRAYRFYEEAFEKGRHASDALRLRQGAIWIVTDDARWHDLKRHMHGQTGADAKIITGDEEKGYDAEKAVNAILVLEAAGLDVRR